MVCIQHQPTPAEAETVAVCIIRNTTDLNTMPRHPKVLSSNIYWAHRYYYYQQNNPNSDCTTIMRVPCTSATIDNSFPRWAFGTFATVLLRTFGQQVEQVVRTPGDDVIGSHISSSTQLNTLKTQATTISLNTLLTGYTWNETSHDGSNNSCRGHCHGTGGNIKGEECSNIPISSDNSRYSTCKYRGELSPSLLQRIRYLLFNYHPHFARCCLMCSQSADCSLR